MIQPCRPTLLCLSGFSLLVGLVTFSHRTLAQVPPAQRPVIRVHSFLEFTGHANQFADSDTLVTADGIGTTTTAMVTSETGQGWMVAHQVLKGTSAQLASLGTALVSGRVGVQQGNCVLGCAVECSGTYELTWFGRGLRSNSFAMVVSNSPDAGPPCPAEVIEIVRQLFFFGAPFLYP